MSSGLACAKSSDGGSSVDLGGDVLYDCVLASFGSGEMPALLFAADGPAEFFRGFVSDCD